MSQRTLDWKVGVATTSDAATITTVATSDAVPDGSVVSVEFRLVGRNTAAAGTLALCAGETGFRRVASVLTMVGTPVILVTFAAGSDVGMATCVVTVDANSNQIRLRVQGIAATSVEWLGSMRLYIN